MGTRSKENKYFKRSKKQPHRVLYPKGRDFELNGRLEKPVKFEVPYDLIPPKTLVLKSGKKFKNCKGKK